MPFKQDTEETIKKRLRDAFFHTTDIWNPETELIQFERLWETSERFSKTVNLVAGSLTDEGLLEDVTGIVVGEKLKCPFGVLPIASALAFQYNKNLMIWKEQGEYYTGRDLVYGRGSDQHVERVGIIHDVLAGGYSVIKIMRALARLERRLAPEKSYEVRFVLAFVRLCSKDTLNQIVASIGDVSGKSLSDKQFICLADLSDLREG